MDYENSAANQLQSFCILYILSHSALNTSHILYCNAMTQSRNDDDMWQRYYVIAHSATRNIMKIYSLSILSAPPHGIATSLSSASDLSSFSFYQKGSVGEFMTFFSKTVAERTPQGQRQSVQENNYTAHVYNRGGAEQLAGQSNVVYLCCCCCFPHRFSLASLTGDLVNFLGVIITDQEYPVRPAFSLLTKVLEEFSTSVPQTSYSNPSSISFPQVSAFRSGSFAASLPLFWLASDPDSDIC